MDRIMLGWLLSGLVMWLLEKLIGTKIWAQAISMLAGLIVCYIVETAWFMVVYARNTGPIGICLRCFGASYRLLFPIC